jgi:uncharacterized membrane protein YsdA (DUF1294 family)/cold shock CspA family protein
MRYQGKITGWKDGQGFGFVTPHGGGDKAFVHIKAFERRSRRPAEGDIITYEVAVDGKRRLRATRIRFSRDIRDTAPGHKESSPGMYFCAIFCALLLLASILGKLPVIVPAVYGAASVVAFVAYAMDKSAARNNRWRTREATLHLLAIVGGWPGALLAQKKLRHKSRKREFQTVFRVTVVLNCCLLGWLFTERGASFLNSALQQLVE